MCRRRRFLQHAGVNVVGERKEAEPVRIRRLVYSLAWLAALVMASGAGWKTS
jgi:hypothetical protein